MDRVLFEKPNHERLVKNFNVVDMHSHTEASHDCGTSLKDYADKLKSLKIGAAITDHDEISASLAFKRNYPKIFLIPGIEATSVDNKHILFYFGKHSDLQDFYNKHIMHHKKKHKTCLKSRQSYKRTGVRIRWRIAYWLGPWETYIR